MAEDVEIKLNYVTQTAAAWGVTEDDPEDPVIWLPKSVCEIASGAQVGTIAEFTIPEWLAIDKGLV